MLLPPSSFRIGQGDRARCAQSRSADHRLVADECRRSRRLLVRGALQCDLRGDLAAGPHTLLDLGEDLIGHLDTVENFGNLFEPATSASSFDRRDTLTCGPWSPGSSNTRKASRECKRRGRRCSILSRQRSNSNSLCTLTPAEVRKTDRVALMSAGLRLVDSRNA
jgi:hypothetical protein